MHEASFFGRGETVPLLGDGFLCLSPLFSGLGEVDGEHGVSLFTAEESFWLLGDDFLCLSPGLCSGFGEVDGWHGVSLWCAFLLDGDFSCLLQCLLGFGDEEDVLDECSLVLAASFPTSCSIAFFGFGE